MIYIPISQITKICGAALTDLRRNVKISKSTKWRALRHPLWTFQPSLEPMLPEL